MPPPSSSPAGAQTGHRTRHPQLGIALMLVAVLNFALMEGVAKFLIADYPLPMIAWSRWTFHFLLCLPFFLMPRNLRFLRTGRPVLHTVRPLILVTATYCFIGALVEMQLADATALVFTTPLIVTLLSPMLLGEKVGMRRRIAVAVGFAGVLVILRPSPDFDNWIALLPLGAGICYALYQLSTRSLAGTEHALTQFFYVGLGGAVITSLVVPFFWVTPTGWDLALMVLSGVFGLLAQFLVIKAFEAADASIISPFLYTQLIWATLIGYVLFRDLPDLWSAAGALIVIGSGVYIWHRERQATRAARV